MAGKKKSNKKTRTRKVGVVASATPQALKAAAAKETQAQALDTMTASQKKAFVACMTEFGIDCTGAQSSTLRASSFYELFLQFQKSCMVDPLALSQELRENRPSFSAANWTTLVKQLKWSPGSTPASLERFNLPYILLPFHIHKGLFLAGWKWQEVHGNSEKLKKVWSEVLSRILASLFEGRLQNKAEALMSGSEFSSGGQVEYACFFSRKFLFIVIEMKKTFLSADNVAQLMLEVLSAVEMNHEHGIRDYAVYGLLLNMRQFYFLEYLTDQNLFRINIDLGVATDVRSELLSGMVRVSEAMFGIMVKAYESTLKALLASSNAQFSSSSLSKSKIREALRYLKLATHTWAKTTAPDPRGSGKSSPEQIKAWLPAQASEESIKGSSDAKEAEASPKPKAEKPDDIRETYAKQGMAFFRESVCQFSRPEPVTMGTVPAKFGEWGTAAPEMLEATIDNILKQRLGAREFSYPH